MTSSIPVVPGDPPSQPPVGAPPAAPPRKPGLSQGAIAAITIGACLFVGALVILGQTFGHLGDKPASPRSDVTMTKCVDTSYGSPKALLKVHNSTGRTVDYRITVVFERGGVQIGSGFGYVTDLLPGQSAETEAIGFGTDVNGDIRCRVSDVDRY